MSVVCVTNTFEYYLPRNNKNRQWSAGFFKYCVLTKSRTLRRHTELNNVNENNYYCLSKQNTAKGDI